MRNRQKAIFGAFAILLLASLAATLITLSWANYRERLRALRAASRTATIVNTRELDTAQQIAQEAVMHMEQDYAQQAVQLADHSVDLAFEAALRDAVANPAPLNPETRELDARIKTAEATLSQDQNRVAELQQKFSAARPRDKDAIQEKLDLAQTQVSLDQDELTDAHEDLIRAGGDKKAVVQKQLDRHEASEIHGNKGMPPMNPAAELERTTSASIVAESRALVSLRRKELLLRQAQANALAHEASLTAEHESREKLQAEEKAQKRIIGNSGGSGSAASNAPAAPEAPAANASANPPANPAGSNAPAANPQAATTAESENESALSMLRHLTRQQKELSELDKRIGDEEQLATVYGNWITFVDVREKAFLHGIFLAIFWILLIAAGVLVANHLVQRFFSDVTPERRELHTMRTVALVVIQALGVALILLVIFGVPQNFATFVALATAGFTVAMKDFIVGFVGWFVLMGKDGIRPGDWVEINGVGGEVLEVGLFRTVLLETGNWSDAAHPTGRKVAFVNSFAIEGHYFNFSTSGQWAWDELQIQVPPNLDPFPTAEAIQKIAADETSASTRQAEEEWTRSAPTYGKRKLSAAPAMSVKPTGSGVSITVRYITRVRDRQEVRSRLYRAILELLHRQEIPEEASKRA